MSVFRKAAVLACAASFVVSLAGCASTATPEAMQSAVAGFQLPQKPAAGKSLVYVVRSGPETYLLGFSPVFVFVDEAGITEPSGYTRSDQYLPIELSPGPHKVRSGMGGEVSFEAKAGEVRFLKQSVGLAGLTTLEEVDALTGKYLMKTREMKPGSNSKQVSDKAS